MMDLVKMDMGKLQAHKAVCLECGGDGTLCTECEDGYVLWPSFVAQGASDCDYCIQEGATMSMESQGDCWRVCFDCYLYHHRELCGCNLWRDAEIEAFGHELEDPRRLPGGGRDRVRGIAT